MAEASDDSIERTDNRLLVWTIVTTQFAPPFMFSGVAVALPAIGLDLGAGATALGLMETLFLAGSVAFLLPAGKLADASDKNTLYRVGLLVFGLSSIAVGALSWMPGILLLRFLQGGAAAVFATTGPAILADLVPAARRGRVFGASLGAIYAGLTLGPVAAGVLIEAWGWRAVFFGGAALLLASYFVVRQLLPAVWRKPEVALHWPSGALLVAAALCLVLGSATIAAGVIGPGLLVAGALSAGGFVHAQRRLREPILDIDTVTSNRELRDALAVQVIIYMNAFCSIFLLSIFMQVSLGHDPATAGRVIAVGSVLMAITAPLAGLLADRLRPTTLAAAGVATICASAVIATSLTRGSDLILVGSVLAVQGLGFALFSSPNLKIIMNSVPSKASSTASALAAKARSTGMIGGMIVTSILISLAIGDDPVERHPDTFVTIQTRTFTILVALSAIAFALSLRSIRRRRPHAATERNQP